MPPFPSQHHCQCGKSTKRAAKLGYCPKCSTVCSGSGTAKTKKGVEKQITHNKWVHYQSESCSACDAARTAIEKTEWCELFILFHLPSPNATQEWHHPWYFVWVGNLIDYLSIPFSFEAWTSICSFPFIEVIFILRPAILLDFRSFCLVGMRYQNHLQKKNRFVYHVHELQ